MDRQQHYRHLVETVCKPIGRTGGTALAVYLCMSGNGPPCPSKPQIQELTGIGEDGVQNAVRTLLALKLIERDPNNENRFRVCPLPGAAPAATHGPDLPLKMSMPDGCKVESWLELAACCLLSHRGISHESQVPIPDSKLRLDFVAKTSDGCEFALEVVGGRSADYLFRLDEKRSLVQAWKPMQWIEVRDRDQLFGAINTILNLDEENRRKREAAARQPDERGRGVFGEGVYYDPGADGAVGQASKVSSESHDALMDVVRQLARLPRGHVLIADLVHVWSVLSALSAAADDAGAVLDGQAPRSRARAVPPALPSHMSPDCRAPDYMQEVLQLLNRQSMQPPTSRFAAKRWLETLRRTAIALLVQINSLIRPKTLEELEADPDRAALHSVGSPVEENPEEEVSSALDEILSTNPAHLSEIL